MDTLRTLLTRRSVRKFQGREVPMALVKDILCAAMSAPSAGNEQPWHFVIVTDRQLLARIPEVHPHAAMAAEAPLAILVCADPNLDKHQGFWVQDCAAACENILSAVWTGIHPRSERVAGFRRLFRLPMHIIPLALIPLGYPAQELPEVNRYRQERVHQDTW